MQALFRQTSMFKHVAAAAAAKREQLALPFTSAPTPVPDFEDLCRAYKIPLPPYPEFSRQEKWEIFHRWKKMYGKVYKSEEEKIRRFDIFCKRFQVKLPGVDIQDPLNELSDYARNEFGGFIPSPRPSMDGETSVVQFPNPDLLRELLTPRVLGKQDY